MKLLEKGKPMLFLHHSLVSYQDWAEYKKIIGGRYNRKDSINGPSTFKHDVLIPVKVVDETNFITKGLHDFIIDDESYGNCIVLDSVKPLLITNHPENIPVVAWLNYHTNSSIIYIQFGQGKPAFTDKNYQKLVLNAIKYLVKGE